MSEEAHIFHLTSVWKGDSNGDGTLTTDWGTLDYGPPTALSGKAGRSNPEELLLAAVTACYSITLAHLCERKRLPVTQIEAEAEAQVVRQPDKTLKYKSIHLRPKIHLAGDDATHIQAVKDLVPKAEIYCPISNAVRGNVEITLEPEIVRA